MISRVAEGCFWLTRYLERIDSLARPVSLVGRTLLVSVNPVNGG